MALDGSRNSKGRSVDARILVTEVYCVHTHG